jgi:hypothetical protein
VQRARATALPGAMPTALRGHESSMATRPLI